MIKFNIIQTNLLHMVIKQQDVRLLIHKPLISIYLQDEEGNWKCSFLCLIR